MSSKKIFGHIPRSSRTQQNLPSNQTGPKPPPVIEIKGLTLFCQDCSHVNVRGTIHRLFIDTIPHGDFCSTVCAKRWAAKNGFRV